MFAAVVQLYRTVFFFVVLKAARNKIFERIFTLRGCSSMVEHQPSKLDTWVRFPSPAWHFMTVIYYRNRGAPL